MVVDGRQARWQAHNEERRRRVIEAALEVIEASEPGAELHVQAVAERAGLSRSVVYRLFADRGELDRAIQGRILDDLLARLEPALNLQGSLEEIIERTVRAYVGWALAHPALHRMADHDTGGDGVGPLQQRLDAIGERIRGLLLTAFEILGARLTPADRRAAEVLVNGLVAGIFGAVRSWVIDPGSLSADALAQLLSRSVLPAIEVHARALGITVRSDEPVEVLIAEALARA